MIRIRHLRLVLIGLVAIAAGASVHSASADRYDPPTVALESVDRTSVRLWLTAGPSGAPAGIKVEWMTQADFDAFGGWPADSYDPAVVHCDFVGVPTLTMTDGVSDFALGPGVSALVEIGDLFDETGVNTNFLEELEPATGYVFRLKAIGDGAAFGSAYSGDLSANTDSPGEGCVHSQGFWKNHPEEWPVDVLFLGDVLYTKQELLDILDQPARGNGLVSLAHQLIAAKLSRANGGVAAPIQDDIDAADAMIGDLVVPPVGAGYLPPDQTSDLTEKLDRYANGEFGDCEPVPSERTTWGRMKDAYR